MKLKVYKETWTLQLADDGYVEVKEYIWVPVNAVGVEGIVMAFIGMVYDLLLSRRWMHRVRASSIYPGVNLDTCCNRVLVVTNASNAPQEWQG